MPGVAQQPLNGNVVCEVVGRELAHSDRTRVAGELSQQRGTEPDALPGVLHLDRELGTGTVVDPVELSDADQPPVITERAEIAVVHAIC